MSRRHVLRAACVAGAAAGVGGCADAGNRPQPQDVMRGRVVARTGDVPVGGGVVVMDAKLVLTQPEEGTFHAFTAVCTHSGCTIQEVTTHIRCLCHGSRFDIATGEVLRGPASEPLPEFGVTVEGTEITLDP